MQERREGNWRLRLISGEVIALPRCIANIMRHGSLSIVVPQDRSMRPQALNLMTGEFGIIYPQ